MEGRIVVYGLIDLDNLTAVIEKHKANFAAHGMELRRIDLDRFAYAEIYKAIRHADLFFLHGDFTSDENVPRGMIQILGVEIRPFETLN